MIDGTALVIGAGAAITLAVGMTVLATLGRSARASAANARPSRIMGALGVDRMPASMGAGVRFALEAGRGPASAPVRTTLAGIGIAGAALVGALVFASSLDGLLRTPRLYGMFWDVGFAVQQEDAAIDTWLDPTGAISTLRRRDDLTAIALGSQGVPLQIDGRDTFGIMMDPVEAHIAPPLLAGAHPAVPTDIVIGVGTSRRLGIEIGDTVEVGIQGTEGIPVTVTGIGVLPPLGSQARFGDGVFGRYELLEQAAAGNPRLKGFLPPPDEVFVTIAPEADPAAVRAEVHAAFPDLFGPDHETLEADEILNFGRVRSMPYVLAGLLGALAVATLIHGLVTAVRRRRRDVAVLRTLGLVASDVRRLARWQSATLVLAALLPAIPFGIAVGRTVWLLFARSSGVVGEAVLPWPAFAMIPGALALAILISVLPGRMAARTHPAIELRSP